MAGGGVGMLSMCGIKVAEKISSVWRMAGKQADRETASISAHHIWQHQRAA
jgi:hypothetical protein